MRSCRSTPLRIWILLDPLHPSVCMGAGLRTAEVLCGCPPCNWDPPAGPASPSHILRHLHTPAPTYILQHPHSQAACLHPRKRPTVASGTSKTAHPRSLPQSTQWQQPTAHSRVLMRAACSSTRVCMYVCFSFHVHVFRKSDWAGYVVTMPD